ncbi:MAG: tetratricopeptide repeat protein [Flavisolibacter sp.]|nr:tetratricopeptide repeat protein [Flavisolibacter sp.]
MKKTAILFFSALVSLGALAQNLQQGINDLYAERYQSAKTTFEKLLSSNPNNIEANYWLGQTYLNNNDVNGAKAIYEKALAASNNAPLILVGMGQVELTQGKAAEARQRFETAINASKGKKGNDPNILNAIGHSIVESYSEQNKTDLDYAISKLNEAAQLAPNNPDIFLNLGNAYRKKRDGGAAIQAYNKAGNFAPALYQAGRIYETQKSWRQPNDWDVVIDLYNRAVAADPRFAPAYERLYNYYLRGKRDFTTAEGLANKYVSSSDPSPENIYIQAQTAFVQDKFSEAINLGKSIISQTNNNPRPRVYRLLTYSYMGSKDTATACTYANQFFEKEKNEDQIDAMDYLMHAQACGKGNPDVILADINKAKEKNPEQAARVLREALDDARKAGNRELEGELSLILFKLQGANANPQNLVSIGTAFYYASNFNKADSLFQAYTKSFPDSIYGHVWSGRARVQIDTALTQGIAIPEYEQVLKIAETDKNRELYKTSGIEAAKYLAAYTNNVKEDRAAAIIYVDRGLAFNPDDAILNSLKTQLTKTGTKAPATQKTNSSNNAAKTETKTKTPDTKTKTKQ